MLGRTCLQRHYPAPLLEGLVFDAIARLASSSDIAAPVPVAGDGQRGALNRELADLQARERNLIEAQLRAMEQGVVTQTYETMLREVAGQKKGVEAQLDALDARAKRRQNPQSEGQLRQQLHLLHSLATAPHALEPLSPALQRLHNLLVALFERIEFDEPERGVIDNLKLTFR